MARALTMSGRNVFLCLALALMAVAVVRGDGAAEGGGGGVDAQAAAAEFANSANSAMGGLVKPDHHGWAVQVDINQLDPAR